MSDLTKFRLKPIDTLLCERFYFRYIFYKTLNIIYIIKSRYYKMGDKMPLFLFTREHCMILAAQSFLPRWKFAAQVFPGAI